MTRRDAYVQNRHLSLDRKEFLIAVQFVRIQTIHKITYVKMKKTTLCSSGFCIKGSFIRLCDTTSSLLNFWFFSFSSHSLIQAPCCSHLEPKIFIISLKYKNQKRLLLFNEEFFPGNMYQLDELTTYSLGKESTIIMSYTKDRIR